LTAAQKRGSLLLWPDALTNNKGEGGGGGREGIGVRGRARSGAGGPIRGRKRTFGRFEIQITSLSVWTGSRSDIERRSKKIVAFIQKHAGTIQISQRMGKPTGSGEKTLGKDGKPGFYDGSKLKAVQRRDAKRCKNLLG